LRVIMSLTHCSIPGSCVALADDAMPGLGVSASLVTIFAAAPGVILLGPFARWKFQDVSTFH
jgi:hypothetical protein